MSWWQLLLFVFFVWCLLAFEGALQVAIENVRHPLPNGQRRGFSFVPIIPVVPLALWGLAELLDLFVDPWGSVIVGSLHVLLALIGVGAIAFALRRLHLSGNKNV